MTCNIDFGVQQDYDNMTKELGRLVTVQTRDQVLNYEGMEGTSTTYTAGVQEYAVIQQLNSTHEVIASGEFKVGDVEMTFLSDSIAEEEGRVITDNAIYKILQLNKINSLGSDTILFIKAFGKKLPRR